MLSRELQATAGAQHAAVAIDVEVKLRHANMGVSTPELVVAAACLRAAGWQLTSK